jgi:hypothetical protein
MSFWLDVPVQLLTMKGYSFMISSLTSLAQCTKQEDLYRAGFVIILLLTSDK